MLRKLKGKRRLTALLMMATLVGVVPWLIARAAGPARVDWRRALTWDAIHDQGDAFAQDLADGQRIHLTLDPRLQRLTDHVLADHQTPYAAAVVLSVDSGRVLALAGRSTVEPERTAAELTLQPWAPAASVFKLVTAAALVEAGVKPAQRVCYHGGVHSVEADNLSPQRQLDHTCRTLAYGLARSQNAILARLAHEHLDADGLDKTARAFGFGAALPFDLPVIPSELDVPRTDPLAFARVASGFWQSTLSPLHGAWLAATLARGGEAPPLRLVDRVVDRAGNTLEPEVPAPRRVISEAAARAVGRMMVGTTEFGSARHGFHDPRTGRPLLPGIAVAGKTGSLNRQEPFLAYSWFVGFAPANRPEVAIAVLLADDVAVQLKAHEVAAELLAGYFAGTSEMPSVEVAAR
jgi:cell division protein FtsI/penicillin-binding protein 2